jgi:hypothetical protein
MSMLRTLLARVRPDRPTPRPGRRAPRLRPGLQSLEDRTVPAGVVNATLAAGVLTITAVNDPTDVNLTNTNHQNITLDGAGGNTITVTANTGETGTAFTGGPFAGVTTPSPSPTPSWPARSPSWAGRATTACSSTGPATVRGLPGPPRATSRSAASASPTGTATTSSGSAAAPTRSGVTSSSATARATAPPASASWGWTSRPSPARSAWAT